MGSLEVNKDHILNQSGGNFQISSYLQDILCYLGQLTTFEEGSEVMEKLTGQKVNAKQIERVSHYYGNMLEENFERSIENGEEAKYKEEDKNEVHYAQVDGGMVLTREDSWKEMKLARIFKDENDIEISKNRNLITESQYVAHLGDHKKFLPKVEYYIDPLKLLVFIADGARWIWNWIESSYPNAIQILDFFHAKEHLCEFAKLYFREEKKRSDWIDIQCLLLLNDKSDKVIKNIEQLDYSRKNEKIKKARDSLTSYYSNNFKRMQYKSFREKGLMIGSGPIESAHRHVIQQRLKLSGQRWTIKGAQQIANLRVANKSDEWNKIVEFTKKAA